MSRQVGLLLGALRDLAKAHNRLSRAVPNPESAQANADAALERLLVLLDDHGIARALADLMPPARERLLTSPDAFDAELKTRRPEMIQVETTVMHQAGAAADDIRRLYLCHERAREHRAAFPLEIDTLKRHLVEVHAAATRQIASSRSLNRRQKKKRKRKIGQGVASAVFGTAAIVADIQLPLVFAFSYGLGGAALHQALRDLVGEAPE